MEKSCCAVLFLVVLITGLNSIVIEENRCSPFEYEYRVLERLIYLENKNKELEVRQEMIEKTEKLPAIGFTVAQRSAHQRYSAGQTVVFNTVITNDGNAYDAQTGVFSAPRNGQYFFAMSIFTYNGRVWMQMMKNDEQIGRAHLDARAGGSIYDSASSTSVVRLVEGDRVYMKFEREEGPWEWDLHANSYNQFTGFFIR